MPRLQLNGNPLVQHIEILSLYLTNLGAYQQSAYNYIISQMKQKKVGPGPGSEQMPSFENMETIGFTALQKPLEALNMIYPDELLGPSTCAADGQSSSGCPHTYDAINLVGASGLNRVMTFIETMKPVARHSFEYKPDILAQYGRIFNPKEIGKYSGKIKNICDRILNSTGIVLVYSQYIDGGVLPIALALEELGFSRAGNTRSLFKTPPVEPLDALTFKTKKEMQDGATPGGFHPAKYVMITGSNLTPDSEGDMSLLTNLNNTVGEKVKVVLISQSGAEGLDYKFIRQVHVLDPWYNMSRIEQIIGRAVRMCSHKDLPFSKRNVEIYLYGSLLENGEDEAADLYVYRLAELKAVQIGHVSRVLKEISVDCLLNIEQTNFTVENMQQTVKQDLSSGGSIMYQVGDKPYSATCDYMKKCTFTCKAAKPLPGGLNLDTYNVAYMNRNLDKIILNIKALMKERFYYTKNDLMVHINIVKVYPYEQIMAALNQLVEDPQEYITDKYGRLGHLINIADLYLFQPLELNNTRISVYDRSVPIEYKRNNLLFHLPEEITEAVIKPGKMLLNESDHTLKKLLLDLNKMYQMVLQPEGIAEDNWYKLCGGIITSMAKNRAELLDFAVAHMIDSLIFAEHMQLLNYFTPDQPGANELEIKIKQYLAEAMLTNEKGLVGMLLQDNGVSKLVVRVNETGKWQMAENEDYIDLTPQIEFIQKRFLPAKLKMNKLIGFISHFKKNYMVFKIKDLSHKRDKGARCDQAGKNDAVKMLNAIIGENKYTVETEMVQKQICVLQEMTLRIYNKERRDGKCWFLSAAEASLINIEKVSL
jgi:hypothetical protein